ncbi:MAG: hypothetical protein RJA22_560 [Verrucomicrobiota bacterium]|jgi:SAM-dependent methyltransferase
MQQGLVLDRVVLLGRTFDEYVRFFALDPAALRGQAILDVAGGVSSFTAEAAARGLEATAFDPIYDQPWEAIRDRCEPDLADVAARIGQVSTYKWEGYGSPENMRRLREQAYRVFLEDYRRAGGRRYVPGRLPRLPFADRQFDLTLVSYLLFVYEHRLDYAFHRDSLREILRVTRGEARFYPLVNFEAQRCRHLDLLRADPVFAGIRFEEVRTDFEFLVGSNYYLRAWRP